MHILHPEDAEAIRQFITAKAKALQDYEKKKFAKIGFDISKWRRLEIKSRVFFTVSTHVFRTILEEALPKAVIGFPGKFGTGNPQDVLDALYSTLPWAKRDGFGDFLQTEQFCWVVEMKDGIVQDRILRIDLFRQLSKRPNSDGTHEFIGGAFHAFKHYSYRGTPLSTHKANHDIIPIWIIAKMTEVFFIEATLAESEQPKYIVDTWLDERHVLRVVFYYENVTGVYFLKTSFKKRSKHES